MGELTTDVYLPEQVAADFRAYLGGMAHLEFMEGRGWVRVHELRDGETVLVGGVEVRERRYALVGDLASPPDLGPRGLRLRRHEWREKHALAGDLAR